MRSAHDQPLQAPFRLERAPDLDHLDSGIRPLDEPEDEGVEEAWALEIERRARRVLAGESTGTDWAEVRTRIASSLPKR